eukprot:Sdes_comp18537_c0_seq1m8599
MKRNADGSSKLTNLIRANSSSLTQSFAILWFRNDLRLSDNPALSEAITFCTEKKLKLIPLYIYDTSPKENPQSHGSALGGASKWWLHHSLLSLEKQIGDETKNQSRILFRSGNPLKVLEDIIAKTKSSHIFMSQVFEPAEMNSDEHLVTHFEKKSVKVRISNGSLLHHPDSIKNLSGGYYKVFTPFWKACQNVKVRALIKKPSLAQFATEGDIVSCGGEALDSWSLLPGPKIPSWTIGLSHSFHPGEPEALKRFGDFVDKKLKTYAKDRDIPSIEGTSKLSAHLHFGEISPVQVWNVCTCSKNSDSYNIQKYVAELGWREFSYYLLFHFPNLSNAPFQEKFSTMIWSDPELIPSRVAQEKQTYTFDPKIQLDSKLTVGLYFPGPKLPLDQLGYFERWKRGLTGYPIVDAAMRELYVTGWMHNRCRMIAASFLTKHLLINWTLGAQWFWDTLVDADLASNSAGWQWVAGTGADASPYFRIFNPVTQSKKFDPKGIYLRKWVPEIKNLPDAYVHEPWLANKGVQTKNKFVLGETYPHPIIDHTFARNRALGPTGYGIVAKKDSPTLNKSDKPSKY